ncbi:hypothetical protein KSP39_PZI010076 [Platanthera zijinensis]|uniref:BPL/LPL catalytic domain-containing protein n=1 Tax=Platanthera zijinensis TaxID=2320716 RepID=A0AAP0G6Q3_9ASPA
MRLAIRHLPSTPNAAASVVAAATAVAAFLFFRRRHSRYSSTKHSSTTGLSAPTPSPLIDGAVMKDISSHSILVLFGKSSQEDQIARTIKVKDTLRLFGEDDEQEEIRVLLMSEIDSIDSPTFRAKPYMDALATDRFGRLLLWSPGLPSTHDVVSKNFCKFPVGTACVADVQYKGRGRGKNVWESPVGCLMFSFTVQMEDGRKVPLLQYVVSLALTEAIKETCHAKGLPQIDVRIKWPNDLYLNGLKVGGILCTSTYTSKKFNISAGVGLNLDNDKPTSSLNAALQEMTSVSHQLGREDILAAYFNSFEKLFEVFLHQGFEVLEELYYRSWLHSCIVGTVSLE